MSDTTDMETAVRSIREVEISVLANAIGFVVFGEGRPKVEFEPGVEMVNLTDEESALTRRAAERALDHLEEHRQNQPLPPAIEVE